MTRVEFVSQDIWAKLHFGANLANIRVKDGH